MHRIRGKQKSPQEVIRLLKDGLQQLSRYDNKDDKRRQKVNMQSLLPAEAFIYRVGQKL